MPVPLDSFTITFLARELDRSLRDREIESIAIGDDRILVVSLVNKEQGQLRFLYDPSFPILCLTEHALGKSPLLPSPRFEESLVGGAISAVTQADLERVIKITVRGQAGRTFHLYFELTPPFPNAFLADSEGRLLAILLRAGTQTRRRTLKQGEPYLPPASQGKIGPFDVTADELVSLPWQKDDEALSKAILGISPFLSKEICWRARKHGSLTMAFGEIIDAYRHGNVTPCVFGVSPALSKQPPEIGLAWYKPTMDGVRDVRAMPSLNAGAASAARTFLRTTALDRRRAAVLKAISKEVARCRAIQHDADRAIKEKELAAQYRRFGELILANPGKIRKGASEADLPDIYSEEPGEIAVPLDPRLTVHANADAYFKRARRAERSAQSAVEAVRGARRRLKELEALRAEAETEATTYVELKQLDEQLGRATVTRKEKEERVDDKASTLGIKPRRFVVSEGWTVLVGRSAAENDVLTHKYASPSDLWFHARQAHGSHVVLRRDKKKTEPSKQAIVDAARIAAYYSKAKNSKHVPVSYTEKRYVKRVRRGAPGLCVMLREKVVFVTPAPPQESQAT